MKTTPCPALSERSQTFSTIAHAAGSLGLPGEALRLAKHLGCPAFRPNGNVNEREFVTWLLSHCWQFWSASVGFEDLVTSQFPAEAARWRKAPPVAARAVDLSEGEFQWLRLVHGDAVMSALKQEAERILQSLAKQIPTALLDGSIAPASLTGAGLPRRDLFTPPVFPPVVPVWRLDAGPFEVLQADKLEFWQWTESGVQETCDVRIPTPPKFLIVPDRQAAAAALPPRNCSCHDLGNPWLKDSADGRRSLLDFRETAAASPEIATSARAIGSRARGKG